MSIESLRQEIEASISVKQAVGQDEKLLQQIVDLADACCQSLESGGKVIFCGNGGSFADAQHLSAEFTSRFMFDRPALASIALGTNSSAMSAIGNDYGYEDVFSREIEAVANPIDVLVAITTSGNSQNILKALHSAHALKIRTIVFTGKSGGKVKSKAECIHIPSSDTARIQECHILLGHILCGIVESRMFDKD